MIATEISRDADGNIRAFTVRSHGKDIICAAVSMLVINTVNSIETLTSEPFDCDYDENGGFLCFSLHSAVPGREAALLLDAMLLGLRSVRERYEKQIEIKEVVI